MKRILRRSEKLLNPICSVFSYCGVILICVLMFLISADVFCRWLLNNPIEGVTEIAQNMTAIIVFLMLPWTTRLGQHVRSNMLLDKFSPNVNRTLDTFSYLIGVALFVGVIYSCWAPLIRSFRIGDYDGDLVRFPLGYVWLTITISSVFCLLQCIMKLVFAVSGEKDELELNSEIDSAEMTEEVAS
jgi:TRAP-type C4-dicarboxylate transport system permease small subunit